MVQADSKRVLMNYIKKNLKKGYTVDSLRWALIKQGYSRYIVEISIKEAQEEMANEAPIINEKPKIVHEIINENDQAIILQKPWWKRIFGL